MQQHYDAAFRLQDSGRVAEADSEHKQFLALALHHIANGRANLGTYAKAVQLYEEALQFSRDDGGLQLDYAGAALDAGDPAKAKRLAQSALTLLSKGPPAQKASAIALLAQAVWSTGDHKEALDLFKAAAVVQPDFKRYYALASAYLALGDRVSASRIRAQMQAKFGDTAMLHMQFGRGFALTRSFDEAIVEFKQAIAKDSHLHGVHYSLGASYMQLYGEEGYARAESEFRQELVLNPNDTYTYPQLGRIAMSQHKFAEAEAYLRRAIKLDPSVPGTYLSLGELFTETDKPVEAEAALRQAVAVTTDPTKNNYEGQRAHYWLGRALLENGKIAEARKELKFAENLAYQKKQEQEAELSGIAAPRAPMEKTHEATPEDQAIESAYERKVGPPMATSFDNLAVHAAVEGNYATAALYFQQTAQWNPTLKGLDRNWGRAAYAAQEYAMAVDPLSRALEANPEDVQIRSMLGFSAYSTHDYAKALTVLEPIEANISSNPPLELAYAGSLLKAGDPRRAEDRLRLLTQTYPDSATPHCLLGEAYASAGEQQLSIQEFRTALQIDPASGEAEYGLSLSLIALGQKTEARLVLSKMAQSGSKDPEVYFQLGLLRLGSGEVQSAIAELESAIKLDPSSAAYHGALAKAYRMNAQPEDAVREAEASEMLQAKRTSATLTGVSAPGADSPSARKNE